MCGHIFDGKAEKYKASRPEYPVELFLKLQKDGILKAEDIAADIGAGTGIFSRQLAEYVKAVYAVEPNEQMRRLIGVDHAGGENNIFPLEGSAEHTGLKPESVDVITAAQAFHWFDRGIFKKECSRILKENGYVILVWNVRDMSSDLIKDCYEACKKHCPGFKGFSNGVDFEKETFSGFFKESITKITIENPSFYDEAAFTGRNLSSSFAPGREDPAYEPFKREIKDIFAKYSHDNVVKYPYETVCFVGKIG